MLLPVSLVSTQTFRRALTASVDNSVEIRSAPSVTIMADFGGKVAESEAWVYACSDGH